MSHSHMPVQHLLKQVEIYKARKNSRDVRPEWVTAFIERVAELFEPLADDGRVGFDCQLLDDQWIIGLYLGSTEFVGGPDDGEVRYNNFQFDLHGLLDCFCEIDQFLWNAFPDLQTEAEASCARSSVMISGRVQEKPLRLRIYSIPPQDAGPGFREFNNGSRQPL